MAAFLLLLVLFVLPVGVTIADDPAPGITQAKSEARNLECERVSEDEARLRYPGQVAEPAARTTYIETGAVACRRRIIDLGERPAREDAILSELSRTTSEIAQAATALLPEHATKTWLVEAYYPEPLVAAKISFATKAALVERGGRVSDRAPLIAAGDVLVLGRMSPSEAYPLACRRYFAEEALKEDEVLLGVVLRDARETTLHAGVCARGEWQWLR